MIEIEYQLVKFGKIEDGLVKFDVFYELLDGSISGN